MGTRLERLLRAIGLKGPKQHYHVDIDLAESLENMALEQARDPDEIAADLLAEGIAKREHAGQLPETWKTLSPREQQVASLVRLGYTNREIGEKLYISPSTVKTHVSNALRTCVLHNFGRITAVCRRRKNRA